MLRSALKTLSAMLASSALLAACGGGGGDPVSPTNGNNNTPTQTSSNDTVPAKTGSQNDQTVAFPTAVISSIFDGTSNSGEPLTILLQDDGSYFIVYSDAVGKTSSVTLGTGSLNNGSFSSLKGLDLSLVGIGKQTTNELSLSASYTEKKSFNGNVSYASDNKTASFTSSYNSTYETLPNLSAFAGVYKGSVANKDLREDNIELTISADGKLTGQLTCGCSITAQLKADGTAYKATLDFKEGDNPLTGKSFGGNVYLDGATKRLYIIGKMTGTEDRAIFVGTRS